ncbi:winged helix-turn-helix transcriptional regulator [Candidatus Bathyarchaeota archaeon]|nr:MAG: winged helix-turn-helix transcriptional regulator [Candidatus Bathyarchaeota archaeon]
MSKSTQVNQDITKEQSDECKLLHSAWNDLTKVWTLPVIHASGLKEPARFNELKRRIQGISATSLAERLNELDQRKIIERKVYPETPPRVEYSLTKKGIELHALLGDLAEWVKKWDKQDIAGAEKVREEKLRPLARVSK